MAMRKIQQVIPGLPASDGAGVKLIRSLGSADHLRADPFLMLDAFSSENPDDYVAGTYEGTSGPVQGGTTEPLYWDVELNSGKSFAANIAETHSVYVYPFEGSVEIGDRALKTHQGGVLGSGDAVEIRAGADGARFLVLAAKPLGEPVVQYGPFVMNTRAEIEQAIHDYQNGVLAV